MDNNRLEKLVKNFVVEDKARLAARNKTMPSSIQYALQKFEKNAQGDPNFVKKTTTPKTNNFTSAAPSLAPSLQVSFANLRKFVYFALTSTRLYQ